MNRIFARILVNSSSNRNDRLLTRELRLLGRDSDDSDSLQHSEDRVQPTTFSEDSDSNEEDRDRLLSTKQRRIMLEGEWLGQLKRQPRRPHVMRHLVLDFLMRANMKDAAETFAREAGIQVGEILESKINKLVTQISGLLDQNKVGEIEQMLDSIDPEITRGNLELLISLKVFFIRKLGLKDFDVFSKVVQEHLGAMLSKPGSTRFIETLKSPYSQESKKTSRKEGCKVDVKLSTVCPVITIRKEGVPLEASEGHRGNFS